MANGELMGFEGKCVALRIKMQAHIFTTNAYVLVLVGCDMVLGVQSLHEFGPILWNFKELSTQFQYNG